MNAPMTQIDRLLLAVSPRREVSRLTDEALCAVLQDLSASEWSNELRSRVSGLVVSEAVNRWMRITRNAGGER